MSKRGRDDLFLPAIMTLCNDAERKKLVSKMKKRYKNGKWTGSVLVKTNNTRGVFVMRTEEATARGFQRGVATFFAAHIMLISHGKYPQEDEQASHLCHEPSCLNIDHLIWADAGKNLRRIRCRKFHECCCRLEPQCLFNAH